MVEKNKVGRTVYIFFTVLDLHWLVAAENFSSRDNLISHALIALLELQRTLLIICLDLALEYSKDVKCKNIRKKYKTATNLFKTCLNVWRFDFLQESLSAVFSPICQQAEVSSRWRIGANL